jgi:hypothetical protein
VGASWLGLEKCEASGCVIDLEFVGVSVGQTVEVRGSAAFKNTGVLSNVAEWRRWNLLLLQEVVHGV